MVDVYTVGLSLSSTEVLSTAMEQVYGGLFQITKLGSDTLLRKVKYAANAPEVVLVILDKTAYTRSTPFITDDVKSKFYLYHGENELIDYLNSKFNLNIEYSSYVDLVKDVLNLDLDQSNGALDNSLQEQLDEKDSLIADLNGEIVRLKEQCKELKDYDYSDLKSENEQLHTEILDLKSVITTNELYRKNLDKEALDLRNDLNELSLTINELKTELKDKDTQLKLCRDEKDDLEQKLRVDLLDLDTYKTTLTELQADLSKKEAMIKALKLDGETLIQLKDTLEEKEMLIRDLELRSIEFVNVEDIKKEKLTLESQIKMFKVSIKEKDRKIIQSSIDINELTDKVNTLTSELILAKEGVRLKEIELSNLSQENIKLTNAVTILESRSRDADKLEESLVELDNLKGVITEFENDVFTKIKDSAISCTPLKARVYNKNKILNKVQFVFAGSGDSIRGLYNNLKNEFTSNPSVKFLVVDLASEVYFDYVFGTSNGKNAKEWFESGGGVVNYTTKTNIPNVKVLTTGLNYLDSSFYLTLDWDTRVQELEDSGYTVIVVCGNINELVPKVFFESFVPYTNSVVYINSTVVGTRNLVLTLHNLVGFIGSRNLSVCVFNKVSEDKTGTLQKYYDVLSQKCSLRFI